MLKRWTWRVPRSRQDGRLNPSYTQDRRLWRIYQRHELADAVHAEVAERESAAADLRQRQPPALGRFDQVTQTARNSRKFKLLGPRQDRHDKPLRRRHGNTHVDCLEHDDAVAVEASVEHGDAGAARGPPGR